MTSRAGAKIFIVGAGPGDPSLMTLRAAALVAGADDLVVDALVPAAIYRQSNARVVYVGKRSGRPSISQRDIETLLIELAVAGRRVVRLHGGDPSVFGRAGEEVRALEEAGIDYEIVPGVSSALAAPLALGISVTERDVADRVVILTGHRSGLENEMPELPAYDPGQTIVLLMALGNVEALVESALEQGYPADLPAVAIANATLPGQRYVAAELALLPALVAEQRLETPATLVWGFAAERVLDQAVGRTAVADRPA